MFFHCYDGVQLDEKIFSGLSKGLRFHDCFIVQNNKTKVKTIWFDEFFSDFDHSNETVKIGLTKILFFCTFTVLGNCHDSLWFHDFF